MMKKLLFSAFLAATILIFWAAPMEAEQYTVDTSQSELVVRLFKAGIASPLAHDHVIRATEFSGEAEAAPQAVSAGSMRMEARAASLRADEPAMRQKYGLEKAMSDKERRQVQETMESADQMNVEKYPAIQFQSTKIQRLAEGQYLVTGVLTIHGVKQPVSFPAVVVQEDSRLRAQASFRFKQSSFGIKPYSAFFGAVRNQDEAVMNIELVLVPK